MPCTVWIMPIANDCVTVTLPSSAVGGVVALSKNLLDRMHELLEKNTDATLTGVEREQLDKLVEMAQFGQLISMALQAQAKP